MKQKSVKDIMDQGFQIGEFSSSREMDNVLSTVTNDLKRIKPDDVRTVFFCTTCDPCGNMTQKEISREAIKLIMENSNLNVRVLSKSVLVKKLAEELPEYKHRIKYSLSTGTVLDEIAKTVEKYTSPIKPRVEALHWLQDNGYQTYGMICPVLPYEVKYAKELLDQVRPEKCGRIWVEAINVRGKSLVNTYNELVDAGLEDHAEALQAAMSNRANWREYSKELFLAFQRELKERNFLDKLCFLQYVSVHDREFFQSQPGAVCL
jgi:DNA repair photolyase